MDSSHRLAKQCSELSIEETKKTMRDFIFLGSKITGDVDCSHEFKRCLLLGRKIMTDLDSNGNPLQYSCLENPRDGGAWWTVVYGVSQSQTWLKWLSSSSRQHIKKQRHYLLTNVQLVKAMFYVLFFFSQ